MFGALGLSLVFVGFTLSFNGIAIFSKIDKKTVAVVNLITATLLIIVNVVGLINGAHLAAAQGFLFAFTYIFIALNNLLSLDPRAFGWYSLFAVIFSFCCAGMSFYRYAGEGALVELSFGILWLVWSLLWLEGFFEIVCKMKFLVKYKVFPILTILEGVLATGLIGALMLMDVFPLIAQF